MRVKEITDYRENYFEKFYTKYRQIIKLNSTMALMFNLIFKQIFF